MSKIGYRKKILTCIVLICVSGILLPIQAEGTSQANDPEHTALELLVILPDMYGANFFLFRDHFESFGWNVTLAGLTTSVRPCPIYGGPLGCPYITVDVLIPDIDDVTKYNAICIVSATKWSSASPCQDLLDSQETLDLVHQASEDGLVISAWCNAVRVLAAADVINGKKVTGAGEYKNEYIAAGATFVGGNVYPVIDGNIVTSTDGQSYGHEACESLALAIEQCQRTGPVHRDYPVLVNPGIESEQVLWSYAMGTPANDGARFVTQTDDGGFLLTGYTFQSGPHNVDILLVKTDKDGNVQWNKTYGGDGREYGKCCIQTENGEYVIVGYTTSYGSIPFNKDVYVLKIDSDGTMIWEKHFGGDDEDEGNYLCETDTGDYLVCGYTKSFGAGNNDVYVIKIDPDGDELWNITIGGPSSDRGNSIVTTSDGNYVIAGATGSYGAGLRDFLLVKINPSGEVLWQKIYGDPDNFEWALSVCETKDEGFLLVGYCDVLYEELLDVFVVKTDADGNSEWQKRYGEGTYYEYGTSVASQGDYFVLCGVAKSKTTGNDLYLLTIDELGNKIYTQKIIGDNSDWACSIIPTSNDTFVLSGYTISNDEGQFDMLLTKVSLPANNAPLKPSQPSGLAHVKKGKTYTYSTSTTDPDNNILYYRFDWGDGTVSDWLGPYPSGDICKGQHAWNETGNKIIKVKARDVFGLESEWSDPLSITVPYAFIAPCWHLLELLFQRFPHMFPLLQQVLDRNV